MQHISVEELKRSIEKHNADPDVDFIDVCTPAEHNAAHIEGVRNVPLNEIMAHVDEFKGKKAVYVHCRSGGRSQIAIHQLKAAGIDADLINVEGGISAWASKGYPVQSD